jgi:ABC-2 type transport system permease protein
MYLGVVGLLGLGLGALVRSTAGAISTLLGVLFAFQIVVGFLPGTWSDHVYKYLPAPAGIAVTAVRPDSAALPPWPGFGLFCLYTAVVLGLAAGRMHRRDP